MLIHGWLFCLYFSSAEIIAQLSPGTDLRWMIYSLPLISFLLWTFRPLSETALIDKHFTVAAGLYLLSVGASAVFSGWALFWAPTGGREIEYFIKNTLIVGGYIVSFVPVFIVTEWMVRCVFWGYAAFVLVEITKVGASSVQFSHAALLAGTFSNLESASAFPLSALSMFFLVRGRRLLFVLSCVLVVLCAKRIAIAGIVAGTLTYVLIRWIEYPRSSLMRRRFRDLPRSTRVRFVAIVASAIALSACVGLFLHVVLEWLAVALGAENVTVFSAGRDNVIAVVLRDVSEGTVSDWLFGHGPGSSNSLIVQSQYKGVEHIHNDWVKLLHEYGLFGSLMILLGLILIYGQHVYAAPLLVLNSVLMITDNTFIYFFHQVVSFLVVRALSQSPRSNRDD